MPEADAVKFQKRTIDIVYSRNYSIRPAKVRGEVPSDQKEGLEFGLDEYREIDHYCWQKKHRVVCFGMGYGESLYFLRQFNVKHNKIASAMIVYEDFLREVASEGKHTFISTGMSAVEDIGKAVDIFHSAGCPFDPMHCTIDLIQC